MFRKFEEKAYERHLSLRRHMGACRFLITKICRTRNKLAGLHQLCSSSNLINYISFTFYFAVHVDTHIMTIRCTYIMYVECVVHFWEIYSIATDLNMSHLWNSHPVTFFRPPCLAGKWACEIKCSFDNYFLPLRMSRQCFPIAPPIGSFPHGEMGDGGMGNGGLGDGAMGDFSPPCLAGRWACETKNRESENSTKTYERLTNKWNTWNAMRSIRTQ